MLRDVLDALLPSRWSAASVHQRPVRELERHADEVVGRMGVGRVGKSVVSSRLVSLVER